ncbi:hypothetical protein FB451DRAFT_1524577, partial [Mycena latifolia]
LPAKPQILHGRDSELNQIVENLKQESATVAILGAGGMGKTSLARATLHHPTIIDKYEQRFFVAADSATTSIELAALIGSHLGLKSGNDLTKPVLQYFSGASPCLLVLDNLETPWEPLESREGVEEFLSLLADIPHLSLLITMRGAERPAKIRWTRPFLQPLKPLTYLAARQTFVDIADDFHDSRDIDKLLLATDNMPLAVDLIAHLVIYEGCSNVLARWDEEKTSLLSDGADKRSNLDASIAISLSSPRMMRWPGAKELLSLLSVLPDGISDVELRQSNLAIKDLMGCKAALLRTSLAYTDETHRLKSLAPIREHILRSDPPSPALIHPLLQHFHLLLDLHEKYKGSQLVKVIDSIQLNRGNLQQLLMFGLQLNTGALADTIKCTLSFNAFSINTGRGCLALMDHIPAVLPQPCDHRLEAYFIIQQFNSSVYNPIINPEALIARAMTHFGNLNDPGLESRFYTMVGRHYAYHEDDVSAAMKFLEKAHSC